MSNSKISSERSREGREISIQEFRKNERTYTFNKLIDIDLILISNRDIHLKTIHKEFLEFYLFITQPETRNYLDVLLIPVFQHLYLLLLSDKGKDDAERFVRICEPLPKIPTGVLDKLLQCKTVKETKLYIKKGQISGRIRVKLSGYGYTILMKWFRACFSKNNNMFHILRVLHENFHLDLDIDEDEKEFAHLETEILKDIDTACNKFNEVAQKKNEKKRINKVKVKTLKTHGSNDDDKTIKTSQPKAAAAPESDGMECNFEVTSSMFKLRDSAKKYVEDVKKSAKDLEQLEQALLSPPDPNAAVPLENDNQEVCSHDEQISTMADETTVKEIIEELMVDEEKRDEEAGAIKHLSTLSPLDVMEVESLLSAGTVSADEAVSPIESEYLVCSDAERIDEDSRTPETVEFIDADMIDVSKEEQTKEPVIGYLKSCHKSNFHSTYPITISGKDILCSSDISPDLAYMACGFLSSKICTWRISKQAVKPEPIGTLRGHKGIVYALAIDSNMKILVSGGHDSTVRIWNIEKSVIMDIIQEHASPVYAVCVSRNSKYFLSASDRHIVLNYYDDTYPVRVFVGHARKEINCVQFHPNCCYFAAASSDKNVYLFKINEEARPVRLFTGHTNEVYTVSFSPCGKNLASADVDGVLIIWDIITYSPIKTVQTGQGIRSISYDISGTLIGALFYYTTWRVYNIADDKMDLIIEAESNCYSKSVHFSKDNKMLIVQYFEDDKSKPIETRGKPKTSIKYCD